MTHRKNIRQTIKYKNDTIYYQEHNNIKDKTNKTEMYEIYELSLYDNHKEWRKCAFRSELENIYDMKSLSDMNIIHGNKVNIISECNLLNDILTSSKHTKNINIYHSLILYVCINTRGSRKKYNNFLILLDSGCSLIFVMKRSTTKYK